MPPYGPKNAKIVVIGDYPGETDEKHGVPFCGGSGEELRIMMELVGIKKSDCYLTNVFKHRPPGGKLDAWLCSKKELPNGYGLGSIAAAKYLRAEYAGAVTELHEELGTLHPNLILALGATACWALGLGSISQSRGVVAPTRWGKCLPIYHPSAVLQQWSLRPVTIIDLQKAAFESTFPEVRRPKRQLLVEPTLPEVVDFFAQYLHPAKEVSVDIENPGGQLNCIALAPSPTLAICIPFVDLRKPDACYWTLDEEKVVWRLLQDLLVRRTLDDTVGIIGQNFLYDAQHLAKAGLRVARIRHDTMLMHHAGWPEMLKGLGFLGSVYTNELSWKQMTRDLGRDK